MQRWNALSEIPADLPACGVTLGNFDGVHRGHRAVMSRLVAECAGRGLDAVAVTFDPHPVQVLRPEQAPPLLGTIEQRLDLLAAEGLDGVFVMPFTRELAAWTPEEFVRRVFVEALHARVVVVGGDTRFGVRNSGDVRTLAQVGRDQGFEVVVVDDQGEAQAAPRWSSSQVRDLVSAGDVGDAGRVLGRAHEVAGVVVHGDHRGRELGYPTANLCQDPDGLIPADGVYAGWLARVGPHGEERLPAAISIGTNPTFEGTQRRVEAYVLDRTDLDLYGERVALRFVERLRETQKFAGIEELVAVMREDVRRARAILTPGSGGRSEPTGPA